jgi:hypothetical protein
MKLTKSDLPTFFIICIYGVFVLNIVDIFYLNRANSELSFGFLLTLIIPCFLACYLTFKGLVFNKKELTTHVLILIIICPAIFLMHIVLTL